MREANPAAPHQKRRNVTKHVRENTEQWGQAVTLFEAGEFAEAAEAFQRMDYSTAQVTFNVATAQLALGEYEEAIEMYTETLRRDPYFVLAYFQRAQAFHLYGWNEDALRDLTEAQTRMRGCKFIDYTNLGLEHTLWECMIFVNIAVAYIVLGLKRHALQHIEAARKSRRESLSSRLDNGICEGEVEAAIEVSLSPSILDDVYTYCSQTERHTAGTCAFVSLNPTPMFRPHGLASLWLNASKRAKKNFLGKSQMIFNKTSLKGTGFVGAAAKAEGKPLPLRPEPGPGRGTALHKMVMQTLNRKGVMGRSQSESCSNAKSQGDSKTKLQLRKMRSRSFPPTTAEKEHRQVPPKKTTCSSPSLPEDPDEETYENLLVSSPSEMTSAATTKDVRQSCNPPKSLSSGRGRPASKATLQEVPKAVSPDSGIEHDGLALPRLLSNLKPTSRQEDIYENVPSSSHGAAPQGEAVAAEEGDATASEAAALVSLNLLSEQLAKENNYQNTDVLLRAISSVTDHLQGGSQSVSIPQAALDLLDEESKAVYENVVAVGGTLRSPGKPSTMPSAGSGRPRTLQSTTAISNCTLQPTMPKSLYNANAKLPSPPEDEVVESFEQPDEQTYDEVEVNLASSPPPQRRRLSSAFSMLNVPQSPTVNTMQSQLERAREKALQTRLPPSSTYQNVQQLVLPNPASAARANVGLRTPQRPPPPKHPKPYAAHPPKAKKPPIPKRPTRITNETLSAIGNPVMPPRPPTAPKPGNKKRTTGQRQSACVAVNDSTDDTDTSSGYCRSSVSPSLVETEDRSRMDSSSSCGSTCITALMATARPRVGSASSLSSQEEADSGMYESIFVEEATSPESKTLPPPVFDDPRYCRLGLPSALPDRLARQPPTARVVLRTRPAAPRKITSANAVKAPMVIAKQKARAS